MDEHDSFRLFSRRNVGRVLAISLLILFFLMAGTWDFADEVRREADAKVARAERAKEAALTFQHPIPYDAVVIQSGDGIKKPAPRLYVRASNRGENK